MKTFRQHQGFTLLELSFVLIIISVITAIGMTAGRNSIESARRVSTNNKLDVIEAALMSYRVINNRIPCPASYTLASSDANYGVEGATPGTCTGGTPAATFGPANAVVEGAVPVKALNLPEEYMYDGWGRKIAYAVWTQMTAVNGFTTYGLNPVCGKITVTNAGAGQRTIVGAYALVSFGKNGHGAYLKSGSRMSASSTNSDEQVNCHCNSSGVATSYAATYVQKDETQSSSDAYNVFDDIVRFRDRWQMQTANDLYSPTGAVCAPGFRVDGAAGDRMSLLGTGDINGDGIQDLILGASADWVNNIYVVFGAASGWPAPPTGFLVSSLNGTNGFKIVGTFDVFKSGGTKVVDLNGDGYDDILIGSYVRSWVLFGGPSTCVTPSPSATCWPSSVWIDSVNGYTGINGTSGLYIWGDAPGVRFSYTYLTAGDIDGDGMKELIGVGNVEWGYANEAWAFVLWGRNNAGWAAFNSPPFHTNTITPANGFLIAQDSTGGSSGIKMNRTDITANIDEDSYEDIVIGSRYDSKIYVIYGRTRADWPSGSTPAILYLKTELDNSRAMNFNIATNGGESNFGQGTVLFTDVNGDGHNDLIATSIYHSTYVWYGTGVRPASAYDLYANLGAGSMRIRTDSATGGSASGESVITGDINQDTKVDILVGCKQCSPPSTGKTSSGSVYVYFQPSGGWSSDNWLTTGGGGVGNYSLNGTDGFRIDGANSGETLMYAGNQSGMLPYGTADINNDGKADLIVGSPYTSANGSNSGSVYVYFGTSNGTWPSVLDLIDLR